MPVVVRGEYFAALSTLDATALDPALLRGLAIGRRSIWSTVSGRYAGMTRWKLEVYFFTGGAAHPYAHHATDAKLRSGRHRI